MSGISNLAPFDEMGRVQMVVETPRGSSIKYAYDAKTGIFTVSRSLALGVTYPFDWGFIPGTLSDDGDPVDALCLHRYASFPGVVLPSRCVAVVDVDQKGRSGRVVNPRIILAPDWQGSGTADAKSLSKRSKEEIEQFFLNATLFTSKDARIIGWRNREAAEKLLRDKAVGKSTPVGHAQEAADTSELNAAGTPPERSAS